MTCSCGISTLKNTASPSRYLAICESQFMTKAVLPIEGRAATTTKLPASIIIKLSSSGNPVAIKLLTPSLAAAIRSIIPPIKSPTRAQLSSVSPTSRLAMALITSLFTSMVWLSPSSSFCMPYINWAMDCLRIERLLTNWAW